MSDAHLISALESLLFVSGEPLTMERLAKTLKIDSGGVTAHIQTLKEKYANDSSCGLELIAKDNSVKIVTKPENSSFISVLTKSTLQENLSQATSEVLAIIAYRSPITRSEIETIRGVNCSFTLRNLLLRNLIERQGNPADTRGYVYLPTFKFLESLGLKNIAALPDYEALSQDERMKMILEEEKVVEKEGEVFNDI
jgi:segregation and condensation protein B